MLGIPYVGPFGFSGSQDTHLIAKIYSSNGRINEINEWPQFEFEYNAPTFAFSGPLPSLIVGPLLFIS